MAAYFLEEAAAQLLAAVSFQVKRFIIAAGNVFADVVYRSLTLLAVELAAGLVAQVLVIGTCQLVAAVANNVFVKLAAERLAFPIAACEALVTVLVSAAGVINAGVIPNVLA